MQTGPFCAECRVPPFPGLLLLGHLGVGQVGVKVEGDVLDEVAHALAVHPDQKLIPELQVVGVLLQVQQGPVLEDVEVVEQQLKGGLVLRLLHLK